MEAKIQKVDSSAPWSNVSNNADLLFNVLNYIPPTSKYILDCCCVCKEWGLLIYQQCDLFMLYRLLNYCTSFVNPLQDDIQQRLKVRLLAFTRPNYNDLFFPKRKFVVNRAFDIAMLANGMKPFNASKGRGGLLLINLNPLFWYILMKKLTLHQDEQIILLKLMQYTEWNMDYIFATKAFQQYIPFVYTTVAMMHEVVPMCLSNRSNDSRSSINLCGEYYQPLMDDSIIDTLPDFSCLKFPYAYLKDHTPFGAIILTLYPYCKEDRDYLAMIMFVRYAHLMHTHSNVSSRSRYAMRVYQKC